MLVSFKHRVLCHSKLHATSCTVSVQVHCKFALYVSMHCNTSLHYNKKIKQYMCVHGMCVCVREMRVLPHCNYLLLTMHCGKQMSKSSNTSPSLKFNVQTTITAATISEFVIVINYRIFILLDLQK